MSTNRIHAKGDFEYIEHAVNAASIKPGMLLYIDSSDEFGVHADEGGRGDLIIGIEDALQGNGVSTAYTDGEIAPAMIPHTGCSFYGLLEDGQNAVIGSELISTGNGKFKLIGDLESGESADKVMCMAEEAKDLTGSNTSDTLTLMRAL